jgi:N-acetylmuramoyl-L-alanine amidase
MKMEEWGGGGGATMSAARVVLDFGHGGSKPGAVYGGVEEKTVNFLLGQLLAERLRQESLSILVTRDGDYDVPLGVRCRLINAEHKRTRIALVISVHHNAFTHTDAQGFEAYFLHGSHGGTLAAWDIVDKVREHGITLHRDGLITTTQLGRRLAMIHKTLPPAVLVEAGYLTNPVDRANAVSPSFRSRVADAIGEGVVAYLQRASV